MNKVKYVVVDADRIIVFSTYFTHNQFGDFNCTSAGFITFFTDEDGNPDCKCSGRSISLGIDSDPEWDTSLAREQILNRED